MTPTEGYPTSRLILILRFVDKASYGSPETCESSCLILLGVEQQSNRDEEIMKIPSLGYQDYLDISLVSRQSDDLKYKYLLGI